MPAPAVVFEHVSFSLGNTLQIFSDLDLEIPAGQRCVLSGTSGLGSSFFARLSMGLHRPSRGQIRVLGVEVSKSPVGRLHELRRRIGFVFRDARLISNLSVERNMTLAPNYHRIPRPDEIHSRVDELLALLGLAPVRDSRPVMLSAEQRMLTALGRAAVMTPELLLCDDPLAGFSSDVARRLLDALERTCNWIHEKRAEPPTVLIAVSDPGFYVGFADSFGVFRDGRVILDDEAPPVF